MLIVPGIVAQPPTPTPSPSPSPGPSVLPDVPIEAPACASDAGSLCATAATRKRPPGSTSVNEHQSATLGTALD